MSPHADRSLRPIRLAAEPFSRRRFLSRLGVGLSAVAGTTLWSGCMPSSVGNEDAGVAVSKPIDGKLNVSWWSHNNPSFVAANTEMIKRFEADNRDIHIVYQYFPYDVLARKLQAAYRAENVADIQQMFGTWVTEYAENSLLDEVPATLAGGDPMRKFWPASLGAYTLEGKLYGIPHEYNLESGGILYNPKLARAAGIDEPPSTWDELVEAGQRLTKHDSKGRATQIGYAFTGNDSITFTFLSMILQLGGDYWDSDGTHVNFHSPQAQQAWTDETELVTRYKVDNTTWYSGDPYTMFFRGQAAMAHQGPWVVASGQADFPDFKDIAYVAEPPYAGDTLRFAAESGWGEVVNAKADKEVRDAAWKFIDFMARPDNARVWNLKSATVPALKQLQNDEQLLRDAPYLEVPFGVLPHGQWVGNVKDRDEFWTFLHDAFVSVELGQQDPIAAITEAEKQINLMIDEKIGP
jgi:multiple sugar transport system substrate-binding protein